MSHALQATALVVIALGTGAAAVTTMKPDMPDLVVPDGPWAAGTVLDGQVFYTTDRIHETGEILTDELHFVDGAFQSSMCQAYCDFGWSEYRTFTQDDVIHFTATTRCPDAPHTVVWYGTVQDGEITLDATWTTRRWYWTRQIRASGSGDTTPHPAPGAGAVEGADAAG